MARGCSNSTLLIRIDERVQVMQEKDIPQLNSHMERMQATIDDMKVKLNRDHYRIETLEKTGGVFNILRLFRIIK